MIIALILAGGTGSRVNSECPKQFVEILGKPVIAYTAEIYQNHPKINAICIVCHKSWKTYLNKMIKKYHLSKVKWVTDGGDTFQKSVINGVDHLIDKIKPDDIVMIHYAASPFTSDTIVTDAIRVCQKYDMSASCTPCYQLMGSNDKNYTSKTWVDRDRYVQIACPQCFKYEYLLRIYRQAEEQGLLEKTEPHTTSLMYALGYPIYQSYSDQTNIKITTREDLDMFEGFVLMKKNKRRSIMGKEQDFIRHTAAIDHFYSNLDSLAEKKVFEGRRVYMFGSSKIASMVIYYLQKKKIKLQGIIDNNSPSVGTFFFGLETFSPNKLAEDWDDSTLVLIASGFQDQMISQLEDMGYQYGVHIIKVIDLPKEMGDYSFVDRTGYVPLTDEEVRESQVHVLRSLKRICQSEGLHYYLAYGTLLGAVRHKGFIPWDDDIDVYIPIKDLDKLIKAVNKDKDIGMISSAAGMDYYDAVSLIYDKSTVCDSNHFPMQITTGVTIDVFPLYGFPDDREERLAYVQELRDAELDMLNKMHDWDACTRSARYLFNLMKKYDMDSANYVGNIFCRYLLKNIVPKEWFAESTELEFEKELFCAPANYDACLRAIYGDYMELPPEDQREVYHFYHVYHKKNRNCP